MKALIEEYEINIPKIHKLIELNKILLNKIDGLDEIILKKLDDLYIESRYPGDMGLLPYGKPTIDDAKKFYNFAKEVFHKVVNILSIKMMNISSIYTKTTNF